MSTAVNALTTVITADRYAEIREQLETILAQGMDRSGGCGDSGCCGGPYDDDPAPGVVVLALLATGWTPPAIAIGITGSESFMYLDLTSVEDHAKEIRDLFGLRYPADAEGVPDYEAYPDTARGSEVFDRLHELGWTVR